ncbi:MAG: CBS domain-containing protein, partial [Clostridia bacterium]|nr:CBS domain-containing protein [Clostridia bacterium]
FLSFFPKEKEPTVTEEELSSLIESVEEGGGIDEEQGDLLQSALDFSSKTVADVLTLRDDIVAIERTMPKERILEIIRDNKYSRLPVYRGDLDHVIGILHIRRYLKAVAEGKSPSLVSMISKPYFVRLNAEIRDELAAMSRNKTSIAIVKDGNGKTAGLVTVEDFLEELVGEIFDEDDVINEDFMKLGGNYFSVNPALSLADVFRRMRFTPPVKVPVKKTVSVFLAERLGHSPGVGDIVRWFNVTCEVEETDAENRPQKVTFHIETPELETKPRGIAAKEEN